MRPTIWWLCSWLSTSIQQNMIAGSAGRSLQEGTESLLTLEDAKLIVHEAPCSPLDASLEGALVHLTCPVNYAQPLGQDDPLLSGLPKEELMGYRLDARMQVFQWEEYAYTRKVGKKNQRDYLYFREWYQTEPPSNSSFFGNGRECKVKNGGRPCYQWDPALVEGWWNSSGYQLGWHTVEIAQNVTAGDYLIPDDALQFEAPYPQVLQPTCAADSSNNRELVEGAELACAPGGTAHVVDGAVAWQQLDSNGTMVDYLTRVYEVSPMETISILAVQRGNSFVPWPENSETPLLYQFVPETASAAQMIEAAKSSAAATRGGALWGWIATISFGITALLARYA